MYVNKTNQNLNDNNNPSQMNYFKLGNIVSLQNFGYLIDFTHFSKNFQQLWKLM